MIKLCSFFMCLFWNIFTPNNRSLWSKSSFVSFGVSVTFSVTASIAEFIYLFFCQCFFSLIDDIFIILKHLLTVSFSYNYNFMFNSYHILIIYAIKYKVTDFGLDPWTQLGETIRAHAFARNQIYSFLLKLLNLREKVPLNTEDFTE